MTTTLNSDIPVTFQDFLDRHADLLFQKVGHWRRTLRGIVRQAETAEGLRLQLVELVDEKKQPDIHLAIRAKSMCLLLTPALSLFNDSPVHAELVNARRPITSWLADIAKINWQCFPIELRPMAKELILACWQLIPNRNDTVSGEQYSRHLLEYASMTLGEEFREMMEMYPLDCLADSYPAFLANRQIEPHDRLRIDAIIGNRLGDDPIKIEEYFRIVMDLCQRLQQVYPLELLQEQMLFILKKKRLLGQLLDLKMMSALLHLLPAQRTGNIRTDLVCAFVEGHTGHQFSVEGLADLETLKTMQRQVREFSRLARQIGDMIREVEQQQLSIYSNSTNGAVLITVPAKQTISV